MFVDSLSWIVLLGKFIDLAVCLDSMIGFWIALILLLFDILFSSFFRSIRLEFCYFRVTSFDDILHLVIGCFQVVAFLFHQSPSSLPCVGGLHVATTLFQRPLFKDFDG